MTGLGYKNDLTNNMKYLIVNMYIPVEHQDQFFQVLETEDYDTCIFFAATEWEYWFSVGDRIWSKVVEVIERRDKIIDVITGAHKVLSGEPKSPSIRVHHWDTYFITHTTDRWKPVLNYYNTYIYHYVYMNNKAHEWRCHLMDLVSKRDLLKYGAVSWHKKDTHNCDWKYFKPIVLKLTDSFDSINITPNNIFDIPYEYNQSFAQLVSESNIKSIFMTEKTIIPLLVGKPFLVATAPGYHTFLHGLGFELYTEIFDYSFDNEQDQEKRFEMILDNFTKLCSLPLKDLPEHYKKIEDKLKYNQQHAMSLKNNQPKIIQDLPNHAWDTPDWCIIDI
jgi:hypothetical protein